MDSLKLWVDDVTLVCHRIIKMHPDTIDQRRKFDNDDEYSLEVSIMYDLLTDINDPDLLARYFNVVPSPFELNCFNGTGKNYDIDIRLTLEGDTVVQKTGVSVWSHYKFVDDMCSYLCEFDGGYLGIIHTEGPGYGSLVSTTFIVTLNRD